MSSRPGLTGGAESAFIPAGPIPTPISDQLALLSRFLVFLRARVVEGVPDIYIISPGAYDTCLHLLPSLDEPVFVEVMFSLRYEVYFDQNLILLRANKFHDTLIMQTGRLIRNRIAALRRSSDYFTKKCLDNIHSHSNAKLHIENGHVLCPDEYYRIDGQKLPGLVIEATFSRSVECLAEKARVYLTSSNGYIQFVMGLTTSDEPVPHRITLHCWASTAITGGYTFGPNIGWEKCFQGDICVGSYINQNTLSLPLRVFGRLDLLLHRYPGVNLDQEITISFTQLTNCFHRTKVIHCDGMELE